MERESDGILFLVFTFLLLSVLNARVMNPCNQSVLSSSRLIIINETYHKLQQLQQDTIVVQREEQG